MTLRALTWNLFHGRDFPPNPELLTWRSRLLRLTERDAVDAQVNRDLFAEFATVLAEADWQIALLQEAPPRWADALAEATGAVAHRVLTSRNSFGRARAMIARLNPDLIASAEGGSNLTLVRGEILQRRRLELTPGPDPERRTMVFTRAVPAGAGEEVCIANMHASAGAARRANAEREVLLAADRAMAWAGGAPLVIGGDLNLRPRDTQIYAQLEARYTLAAPTAPDSLDHLLVSGLEIVDRPTAWPRERRQVADRDRVVTLSDHAPVTATFVTETNAPDAAGPRT